MSSSHAIRGIDNPAWTSHFGAVTRGMTHHALLPGFWREAAILRELVLSCFEEFGDRQGETPVLRIFVDRGLRYDLQPRLLEGVSRRGRSFESWIQRQIGYEKFCLTLNGVTRWSEPLHRLLQKRFINPLIAAFGAPIGGIDFYCFVGNYGPTPFGIHNDAEHSLLLHLGPDPKTVYLWPRRKFEKLQHRKPQKQYIKSQAITYKLKTGDLMFIPKGDYHVLESRRFSVSLGCSLFPATRKLLLSQMIDLIPDETNPSEPFFINWDPLVEFDHALCRALAGRSLEDDLHRYLLLVRSNGYVTAPPGEYLGDCTGDLMSGKRFRVPVEFPIICSRTKNRMLIVMRGRALTLRFHPSVLAVIHWLNRQTEFSYEELARRLRKVLDENAIKYLFQHLLRFRGVEFCDGDF